MFTVDVPLVRSSYPPGDVTYLLREVTPVFVTLEEKERLIQGGGAHYGHLLSPERAPRPEYRALFERTLALSAPRLAAQVMGLAHRLRREAREERRAAGPVVLVSLARGGTPIGVLVTRALRLLGEQVAHYGVSIVRDHGVDAAALDWIRARHEDAAVVFLDGWTGKGVIAGELRRSVAGYNASRQAFLRADLYVVSDPCGLAHGCATRDDYLVPNAMLGATVSGLISRTLLPEREGTLHGAAYLSHLEGEDVTVGFVETVARHLADVTGLPGDRDAPQERPAPRAAEFLMAVQRRYGPRPLNHIKPGVGEATRVLLRRAPEVLLLRNPDAPEVEHLLALARERDVPVQVWGGDMPYRACALIRSVERDP